LGSVPLIIRTFFVADWADAPGVKKSRAAKSSRRETARRSGARPAARPPPKTIRARTGLGRDIAAEFTLVRKAN
jgi:hypothetical protein